MSALGVWILINSCGLQDHYEDFCGVLEIVEDAYSAYNALETQFRKGEWDVAKRVLTRGSS